MSVAGPEVVNQSSAEQPDEILCHRTMAYFVAQHAVNALLWLFCKRRFIAREKLPAEGGFLLVGNHQSFLDIPLMAAAAAPRHISFVARDSLARSRALGWLMRRCGVILVRRGKADRVAVKEMVAHLQRGDLVALFPEGTRSPDGQLGEFKGGALLAARRAKVPIVTFGIRGTIDAWSRSHKWPRPSRISLEFGSRFNPTDADALDAVRSDVQLLVGDGRYTSQTPESGETRESAANSTASAQSDSLNP